MGFFCYLLHGTRFFDNMLCTFRYIICFVCVPCACQLSVSVTSSLLSLHSVFVVVSPSPGQIKSHRFQHKEKKVSYLFIYLA